MDAATKLVGALTWIETSSEPGIVEARPHAWGDVVLARKETPTSYHLSVVVDDALQGATHVVRGQDLYWSTSVHRLLQGLLGLPAADHIISSCSTATAKLSKSTRATGFASCAARHDAGGYPAARWSTEVAPVVLLGVVETSP